MKVYHLSLALTLYMLWGIEADVEKIDGVPSISRDKFRQVFDFIITLEEPILRGFEL